MYNYLIPEDDSLPMRLAGPWAAEKLDYLARYINIFETSMRSKWHIRNYVDLLAGPGKNWIRETGTVMLGSPLLALTAGHSFTGYYFVDFEEKNAAALRQRCSAWSNTDQIHIHVGDCNLVVDQIVAALKRQEGQSLNLAFLDPEGLELQWRTVASLGSLRRMDLIINYPQGGLNRFMRQAFENETETAVDRFFGDPAWRGIYDEWLHSPRVSLHRRLIDFYKGRLRKLGYYYEEIGQNEFGDEPLMRNAEKNAPLYRLLFASKSELGNDFWHKITRRDVHGQARLFE